MLATFFVHYGPDFPRLIVAAALLSVLLLGFFLHGRKRGIVLCVGLGLLTAMLYNHMYIAMVQEPMSALDGTQQSVVVELCSYPRETSAGGAKATVRFIEPRFFGKAVYYGDEELFSSKPGTRIKDTVTCADASCIRDEEVSTYTSRGEFLFLYGGETPVALHEGEEELRYLPQRLAEKTKTTIDAIFPARSAGFMRSLLMGDKSCLSAADSSALSEAGLFHITAVSGLHCAFLLFLITQLFSSINRRMLGLVAIPILAFYALMTGASPSVMRACIMLSMLLIAPIFYRESDGLTSMALSLLLILLDNPFAIASVSLQLSYAAVCGILFLTLRLNRAIGKLNCGGVLRSVLQSLSVTAGALLFTTPLCAYYFGVVSTVAPIANLLCLAVTSVVFGFGMAATVLGMLFPLLGSMLALAAHYGVLYILVVAKLLTKIPHHALYFENPYLWPWLVYAYLLFFACFLLKRGKLRYVLSALCVTLTLCASVLFYQSSFASAKANIVVANVGQGQSIVLMSGEECAVIDCGSSNYAVAAGNTAADILYNAGYEKLDRLFITHYDADHVNGAETLFARIEVCEVVLPELTVYDVRKSELERLALESGAKLTYVSSKAECFFVGALEMTAYPPLGEGGSNERALSFLATLEEFNFLATGDINRAREKEIVKEYCLPDVEVLVAGHHGAKGSTQRELLDAVTAEVGIVSVGSNSYGHPANETLYRMTDRSMAVYRTDYQGNIYIRVN